MQNTPKINEKKIRVWEPRHGVMVYPDVIQLFHGKVDRVWAHGWKFSSDSEPDMKRMDSTGLKDKNGKDIYEGDIIKENGKTLHIVRLDTVQFMGFVPFTYCYDGGYECCRIEAVECEVIGNVYENKELFIRKCEMCMENILDARKLYEEPAYENGIILREYCDSCREKYAKTM